mgnify:CR=1 FL=1
MNIFSLLASGLTPMNPDTLKASLKIMWQGLLAIFIVICGLLAGISVFAGGVLSPVKNVFFTVLSPMQEGTNSIGNFVFSWNEKAKSKKALKAENEKLQEKVDALKMQNRVLEQNQVELERLQDLLKLKKK